MSRWSRMEKKLLPNFSANRRLKEKEEERPVTVQVNATAPTRLYDAYIVNLPATLSRTDTLVSGVDKVIESLRTMRRPVYFMSSNSHINPADYRDALAKMGLEVKLDEIFTPSRVAVEYLRQRRPHAKVFAIGSDGFIQYLKEAGITLSNDPNEITVVLVAHDRNFNFEKLSIAFQALIEGPPTDLVTTSMVMSWPNSSVRGMEPGTGALVEAISQAAGVPVTVNLGIPERGFVDSIFSHINADPERVLLVSDALNLNIRMAREHGMETALLISSDTNLKELAAADLEDQPHFVVDSLAKILPTYIMSQL